MWWECSECGGHSHGERAPVVCDECGTAGAIFVRAEADDSLGGNPDADSLRDVWLHAGLERARASLAA
jgi:hypothetical protein